MPNFISNLGLDFFYENDETMMKFISYLTQNGKAIPGYLDCPTFFNPMGDIDFFVKTRKNEEGTLEVVDLHTHCCGRNIWEMRNTGINITPDNAIPADRVYMFRSNEDGSGLIPIHLVNGDVLPSFLENDVVNMQMCAFPLTINYYANEEEYSDAQPTGTTGKRFLLADGALMAVHFLANHTPTENTDEKDYATDDHVTFRGTVKRLQHGVFKMDEYVDKTYIRCVIDTPYGELHFAHTIDQVDSEQHENLHVGAIVSGICVLSGDVAVKEYTDGIVKDLENNIRLIKQVIVNGQAERLTPVLCEDATYFSESSNKSFTGLNEIVERFNYVHEVRENPCYAVSATITQIDSEELDYPVGTRCVLVSYDNEDNYDAIVFIDITESGDIKRIYFSEDARYHFAADDKPCDTSPLDDIQLPESVIEPILNRAKFHNLINDDINIDEITGAVREHAIYKYSAERMLNALKENPQPDAEQTFENIFGYLFAKTIELNINEIQNDDSESVSEVNYSILDAFAGKITTSLDEEKHNKIVYLLDLGKQFYKDFKFYIELDEYDDDKFMSEIKTALIVVQHIGYLYAIDNFKI